MTSGVGIKQVYGVAWRKKRELKERRKNRINGRSRAQTAS